MSTTRARPAVRVGSVLAIGLPIGFLLLWAVLRGLGEPSAPALAWAGLAAAAQLAGTVLFARMNWSGWFPSRFREAGCGAVYGLVPASVAAGLAHAATGSRAFTAAAAGIIAVAAGSWYWRSVRGGTDRRLQLPMDLPTPADAERMIAACHRQLAAGGMQPMHRAMVRRNLAASLIVGSARADGMERLDEATGLLAELVQTRQLDPWVLALAVRELVLALSMRVTRHDIADGYGTAVRMQLDMAARLPDDPNGRTVRAGAQADLGDYAVYRMTRLDPSTAEFETERRRAAEAYRKAIRDARRGLLIRATAGYALAVSCAPDSSGAALTEAIDLLRRLEDGRLDGPDQDQVDVPMAKFLLERAGVGGPSAAADLEEAVRRARRATRRGLEGAAAHAALLLAQAEALRHEMQTW
jgi:hypothetical protein